MIAECQDVLQQMLELHQALASQNPALAVAAATAQPPTVGSKRTLEHVADSSTPNSSSSSSIRSEVAWQQVEAAVTSSAAFRDTAVDKWHRRTVLSSGGAALRSGTLTALQQSISVQVAGMMKDARKLLKRTQMPLTIRPRPLCDNINEQQPHQPHQHAASKNEHQNDGDDDDDALDGMTHAETEDDGRDPETYDDGEFYQQLLKQLIDSGDSRLGATAVKPDKRRKVVDRRASKGRKIRYQVIDKLVNFMAPMELQAPTFAQQLFGNLFGTGAAAMLQ